MKSRIFACIKNLFIQMNLRYYSHKSHNCFHKISFFILKINKKSLITAHHYFFDDETNRVFIRTTFTFYDDFSIPERFNYPRLLKSIITIRGE